MSPVLCEAQGSVQPTSLSIPYMSGFNRHVAEVCVQSDNCAYPIMGVSVQSVTTSGAAVSLDAGGKPVGGILILSTITCC
jgi:hypothetical protein